MKERSFFDTNILVYTDDPADKAKQKQAMDLIADYRRHQRAVVSTQVLQEYYVAATKKLGVKPEIARRKIELFAKFQLAAIRAEDILNAIDLQRLHSLSFWDALIIRSATESGCRILFSEDMQHRQQIGGLQIVNPFV